MASNLHYSIQAKLYFNKFDLDTVSKDSMVYHHNTFGAVNIGLFLQTKTMFGTREALAQIRLNQIPLDLVKELNSNSYYMEIIISQGTDIYYHNYYNIVEADYDTSIEPRLGTDLVSSNIILKSMIQTMMEKDKSLTDIQVAVQSNIGYVKSRDLMYQKLPGALVQKYGTAFQVINDTSKNLNNTAYKTLMFSANLSNLDNIEYMHNNYPLSLNYSLYGFDEGFDARLSKNITELVIIDICDTDTWKNQSEDCLNWENDPDTPNQSQPGILLKESLFPNTFYNEYITSTKRVTNIIDNSTYDLKPTTGIRPSVPVFNKMENQTSAEAESKYSNDNLVNIETTLSEVDYILQLEALIALYQKKPQVYQVDLTTGAPYDYFRLGRQSNLPDTKNNITVAADIRFIPNPNPRDVGIIKETHEKTDPFLCTGLIETISYD